MKKLQNSSTSKVKTDNKGAEEKTEQEEQKHKFQVFENLLPNRYLSRAVLVTSYQKYINFYICSMLLWKILFHFHKRQAKTLFYNFTFSFILVKTNCIAHICF